MNKEDYVGQLIENEREQLRDNFDQQKSKYFNSLIKEKDKEIERLNNIIDELEKWLKESAIYEPYVYNGILYKLKELKKGVNNE